MTRATLLAAIALLLVGCQDIVQSIAEFVAYLVMLVFIGIGLGLLALLGMLGMTVSAFRNKSPELRLGLSTLLAIISIAAVVTVVVELDTLGFIEAVLALIPTPAVLWAFITWGEFFDLRSAHGRAPSSTFRSLGLVACALYVAAILAFTWNDHGRPSWEQMFPPPSPQLVVPTVPLDEPIEELHTRGSEPVALTKSGRLLVLDGSRAVVHPGVYATVVTSEDAGTCGVTASGEVSCVGRLKTDAVSGSVGALALSAQMVCRTARGSNAIECVPADAETPRTQIPNTREVAALALDQKDLYVLGKDQVVLAFDAATGKPIEFRLEKVALLSAGGDTVCFIGPAGDVRCRKRGALRSVALPFPAVAVGVSDYVGCAVGGVGELACWSEFDREEKARPVALEGKAEAVFPGDTFYVNVKLGPSRFLRVDHDLALSPIELPTLAVEP